MTRDPNARFPIRNQRSSIDRSISFEEYMDYCLYDPEVGYYRPGRTIIGPQGDFVTSPYLHPLFSELLSEALAAYLAELEVEKASRLDLVEMGAGEGVLADDVLRSLQTSHGELFGKIRYHAVEVDRPQLPGRIYGVVFSNEFFDALPVHRVRIRDGRPKEIYVDADLAEREGELSDPEIEDYLKSNFQRLNEGVCYEVNLRMVRLLRDLDQVVECGVIVTIDYGYDAAEYDLVERPEGTLLCYRQHQVSDDPYRWPPGSQDITAHVNFEAMRRVGEEMGWKSEPLRSQRQFLEEWGLVEKLTLEEGRGLMRDERAADRVALKNLLQPGGICDVMKVLVQRVRTPGKP